ncbi:MAG: hypothetical protein U5J99_06595 [Parvularculaceae bacterium]|nr:hypothetical protein [Parvularculaceae bacterium]
MIVRLLILAMMPALLAGCAVTAVAGAAVEAGATVAKTGVKAGGAVAGGAIDVVDSDEKDPENDSD